MKGLLFRFTHFRIGYFPKLLVFVKGLTFILLPYFSGAQVSSSLEFLQISLKEGLSQSVVFKTIQDKEGFLWFGTQDGLNKFDGYSFTVYRFNPGNHNSLSNNCVWSILEDSQGIIWIGTRGGGLNRFDKRTQKFTSYRNNPGDSTSLSSNFVYCMVEDKDGSLWLGTEGGGLILFDKMSGKCKVFKHNPTDPQSIPADIIYSVIIDSKGDLWAGTFGGGLCKLNRQTMKFTIYRNIKDDRNCLSNDFVRSLFEDRSGCIWVGTHGGGLNKFDKAAGHFTSYKNDPDNPYSISNDIVYAIFQDSLNNFWVGTYGGGLNLLNISTNRFTAFKNNPLKKESLSSSYVISLFEDKSRSIWIGTYGGGLSRYTRYSSKFGIIRNDPLDSRSITSNAIRSVYVDKAGIVWVGTRGGGLNRLDKKDGLFYAYKRDFTSPLSISNNSVYSILEDEDGTLWLGTYGGGLNSFNRKNNHFKAFVNKPNDKSSLSNNNIYSVLKDHLGYLWIGTDGGGLNRFDRKTERFKVYKNDPEDSTSLSNNIVISLFEDEKGNLWIGTRGGGLNRYDRDRDRFTSYLNDPNDRNSIPGNSVMSIVDDALGNLWIGTDGGGLSKLIFDKDDHGDTINPLANQRIRFYSYSIADGLPNSCVYGILSEDKGTLWLSTNKGVCRFTPPADSNSRPEVRNYDYFDGLPSNEFNTGAYYKSSDGTMYFGSIAGLVTFNPDSVIENPYKPDVSITKFLLFNQEVKISPAENSEEISSKPCRIHMINGEYYLPESISYIEELILSHDERVFTFEFASLDYSIPEKNQYAYMMEGFDKDWNSIGTRRYATYTNLSHGVYTFRVKGSNGDGVWNDSGSSIRITILPPFWKTLWFRISAVVILVTLVYYYIKRRENKLKKDKEILEVTVKERTIQLKEANEELAQQNEEISSQRDNLQLYTNELKQKNEEIVAQRDEIQNQKMIIEKKNINITASIAYAKSIQQAILPEEGLIKTIFPDSFVIYKPKDIVSGDFFLVYETADKIFFSVVDCTGHGVPGALMSVMGYSYLRQAIHESAVQSPADVLNHLSLEINSTLRKEDQDLMVKDGMDLVLCALHKKTQLLEYAGVHNHMYILRDKGIFKFKPDNHPVGDPFTSTFIGYNNKSYQLEKGDSLYLLTDGYIDQFGGPRYQKFSSKQFEKLIIDFIGISMNQQKDNLNTALEKWMNGFYRQVEQTDDITVLGIRI